MTEVCSRYKRKIVELARGNENATNTPPLLQDVLQLYFEFYQ